MTHHSTNNLNRVNNTNYLARLVDDSIRFGFDHFHDRLSGRSNRSIRLIYKQLILSDNILFSNLLEAIARAFQQIGQHLFDRFVRAGITFYTDFAHLCLAESYIKLVLGKEFFQGFIQGARLYRKRNQRVERLGFGTFWKCNSEKKQEQKGQEERNRLPIILCISGYIQYRRSHLRNNSKLAAKIRQKNEKTLI